jgi:hypothetical protein
MLGAHSDHSCSKSTSGARLPLAVLPRPQRWCRPRANCGAGTRRCANLDEYFRRVPLRKWLSRARKRQSPCAWYPAVWCMPGPGTGVLPRVDHRHPNLLVRRVIFDYAPGSVPIYVSLAVRHCALWVLLRSVAGDVHPRRSVGIRAREGHRSRRRNSSHRASSGGSTGFENIDQSSGFVRHTEPSAR